jgi:hypothetical protein
MLSPSVSSWAGRGRFSPRRETFSATAARMSAFRALTYDRVALTEIDGAPALLRGWS